METTTSPGLAPESRPSYRPAGKSSTRGKKTATKTMAKNTMSGDNDAAMDTALAMKGSPKAMPAVAKVNMGIADAPNPGVAPYPAIPPSITEIPTSKMGKIASHAHVPKHPGTSTKTRKA